MNSIQLNTVLAALRYFQANIDDAAPLFDWELLSADQINELYEQLNTPASPSPQAETAKTYLQFVLEHALTFNEMPSGIPVPVKFQTEDGWEFELNRDRVAYESADGMNCMATEILKLMLLDGQAREDSQFPSFEIKAWDVLQNQNEQRDIEIILITCPECNEPTDNYAHGSAPNAICTSCGHEWDDSTVDELRL